MCEPGDEPCPPLRELLLAMDGDLPPERKRSVHEHMRGCPSCREEMYQVSTLLQDIVNEYADVDDLAEQRRYARFLHRLATERRAITRTSVSLRDRARLYAATHALPAGVQQMAAAVLLVPMIVVAFFMWSAQPFAHAEALLDRAGTHERISVKHAWGHRLRMAMTVSPTRRKDAPTVRPFSIEWDVAYEAPARGGRRVVPPLTEQRVLRDLLALHHFDLRQPLSIACFQAWRTTRRSKDDEVVEVSDRLVALRTKTSDGRIRNAELTLRRDTFEAVRQTLELEDIGRLEIEQVTRYAHAPASIAAPALTPVAAAVSTSVHPATLQERDLDARLVLQDLGADVRDDIRVAASSSAVRVEGMVTSDATRQQLIQRLTRLSSIDVTLHLKPQAGGPAPEERSPELIAQLDARLGERPMRATFVADLVALTQTVRRRALILQELVQRYPAADAARLSLPAHRKLQQLVDVHHAALNADLLALEKRIAILWMAGARRRAADEAPANWPDRVAGMVQLATTLDQQIGELLTSGNLTLTPQTFDDACQRVGATFSELWESVNAGLAPFAEY